MMAFTFPLTTAQFFGQLLIAEITFDAPEQVEVSQTGRGEVLSADLAPMLWTGEVRFGAMHPDEASFPEVMLDILRPAGRTFHAHDTRRPRPLADPTGAILGAATPTIASLPASRELTIAGLPAAYVLSRGDYIAFNYGTPARRALHRIVTAVVANGAGITPVIEVTPVIRPGAAIGAAIILINPSCTAKLMPASVTRGTSRRSVTRDASFRFMQTLGAI
jgi:hypothetical protein